MISLIATSTQPVCTFGMVFHYSAKNLPSRRIVVILFSDSEPWGKKLGANRRRKPRLSLGNKAQTSLLRALRAALPRPPRPPHRLTLHPLIEDPADTAATPKATIKPVVWGIIGATNGLLERCNRDNLTNRAHGRPSIKFGGSSLPGPLDPPDAEPQKAPFSSAPTPAFGSAQAGRPPAVGC